MWQFVTPGFEDWYDPLQHLCATIFAAGFDSIFYNNFFELGLVYAFKGEKTLEDLRDDIRRGVDQEAIDLAVRASLAIHYFYSFPVPREWRRPKALYRRCRA